MWGIDAAGWSAILLTIAWLILLEGLLSADNALVLAVMVRHLPDKKQQKRALRYGIWGAFIFRLIAVVFATLLLEWWWVKVLGGLYLLYLAGRHFLAPEHASTAGPKRRLGSGFWATVLNVEIADIAFSIDSILAAVAMAEKLPGTIAQVLVPLPLGGAVPLRLIIIYLGGVLGIITMRLVAGVFLVVLERFKGLAEGAYALVAWIGVSLIEGGIVHAMRPPHPLPPGAWQYDLPAWVRSVPEIPEWFFWTVMVLIVLVSLLYKPRHRRQEASTETAVADLAGAATGAARPDAS